MRGLRARMSYANVVATMALFLALGGVGYAATQLPRNSVGSKQLRDGAVTAHKISAATRKALHGARGLKGSKGDAGVAGATNVIIRRSETPTTVTTGTVNNNQADCVGSERAVGGGMVWDETTDHNMRMIQSDPRGVNGVVAGDVPNGWAVTGSNDTGTDKHLRAFVVCAAP
jgi:hypothetical protein